MVLAPLPIGFLFILANRAHALAGLAVAAGIGISGSVIYLIRAKKLREWPFAPCVENNSSGDISIV